ncbi:MAG: SDR family oxidoreductase [Proteobacteria bacterium]|nr:SDR family oxidoreductase [Pseudomonadota bacterium]
MPKEKRLALITGGSRGIGKVIAERLQFANFEVLTPTRSELDLANPESVTHYIETHKHLPISVLVNSAGINLLAKVESISLNQWQAIIQVNLTSPFMLIQGFSKGMKELHFGRIVNVSSIFSLVSKENRACYSATKSGLNGLTRTAAIELGCYGILVNAICPGYIDTDLTRQNNTPEEIKQITATIPLGRMADTKEIAEFVGFLCSEQNSYITGQTLIIDGGFTCR